MILSATGHREIHNTKCRPLVTLKLLQLKPELCIVGGAKGFDTIVGWACAYLSIPFDIYLSHKKAYVDLELQKLARTIKYINEQYSERCHLIRDEAMVNDGNEVIAWYDGRLQGGTIYTVKYAEKLLRKVHNIYE